MPTPRDEDLDTRLDRAEAKGALIAEILTR